jgi:Leucine-rich repeat (LRR) protein
VLGLGPFFEIARHLEHLFNSGVVCSQNRDMAPAVLDSQLPSPTRYAEFFLCGAFISLSFATLPLSSQQINNRTDDDRQALLYFKSGISQDPRGVLASWRNDSLNFCSWKGVTCSTTVPIRVVSIDLRSLQLGGQLSNCIATLTSLVRIDISNNGLSGKIPDELGALPRLETLMLTGNSLEGNIPPSFRMDASLRYVDLVTNKLSGVIPDYLHKRSFLRMLILFLP